MQIDARGFARETRMIEVEPGQDQVMDIGLRVLRLIDMPPLMVTGIIRDSSGTALGDATVTATAVFNSRFTHSTRTLKDGTFKLSVTEGGQYVIVAHDPTHAAAAATLVVKPPLQTIDLRLQRLVLD
jgi:hypothetical protein